MFVKGYLWLVNFNLNDIFFFASERLLRFVKCWSGFCEEYFMLYLFSVGACPLDVVGIKEK